MLQAIVAAILLVGLVGAQSPTPLARAATQPSSQPTDVSVVQLIATPERFDGRLIRVIGFLHLEFEGNALYLHETDFCHQITMNAIWVDVGWPPDEKQTALSDTYVLLEGVFNAQSKGHFGMFAGSVQKVSRLSGWNVDSEPRRCDPRRYAQPNKSP